MPDATSAATDRSRRDLPRGFWALCAGVFFVGFGARLVLDVALDVQNDAGPDARPVAAATVELLRAEGPAPRTAAVYAGLGVWIDAFDFSPAYQGEGEAPVVPAVVDELTTLGVRTIYLQASRPDDRAPGVLLEEDLLAEFLVRAHAHGMQVVGWYLPTFTDVDADLERLSAVADFERLGHRFDGVAVDIEYIRGVEDPVERSARLVELSSRLRDARAGEALGAIVPPPVQLEVINPDFWPSFPWQQIVDLYDVWLPMAYWTTRTEESGYRDPYRYAEESTRRLRADLGSDDAAVHLIGGIGDATTVADLGAFRRALVDTGAVGGSIYDWNSLPPQQRAVLPEIVPTG